MKFTDAQLRAALWQTYGNHSETARILTEVTGKSITRMAVWTRVSRLDDSKELMAQIKEAEKDFYEGVVQGIAAAKEKDVPHKTRLDAAKFFLNNKARDRGYNSDTGATDGEYTVNIKIQTDATEESDPDLQENDE